MENPRDRFVQDGRGKRPRENEPPLELKVNTPYKMRHNTTIPVLFVIRLYICWYYQILWGLTCILVVSSNLQDNDINKWINFGQRCAKNEACFSGTKSEQGGFPFGFNNCWIECLKKPCYTDYTDTDSDKMTNQGEIYRLYLIQYVSLFMYIL